MKKFGKIHLKDQNVLKRDDMKKVVGRGSGNWCCVSGDCTGPMVNCTDAGCQSLYGSGAYCG